MLLLEIFYCVSWVSALAIIWFYTDWITDYCQLLEICHDLRLNYLSFVIENPSSYFPDFLYEKSLETNDPALKFLAKLGTCPFCLIAWMSLFAAVISHDILITAPVYICSLFIVLQTKKMF